MGRKKKVRRPLPPGRRAKRDALAVEYLPLVRKVAVRLAKRLPGFIPFDDLVSSGNAGLLEAAEVFDPDKGVAFETFAEFRIRGAMLDAVRRDDCLSRDTRAISNFLAAAVRKFENEVGRAPDADELAARTGMTVDDLHGATTRAMPVVRSKPDREHGGDVFDKIPDPRGEDPLTLALRSETTEVLVDAIERLPRQMQTVLSLAFGQDLKLREIGVVLDLSESRICQIVGQATRMLRTMIDPSYRGGSGQY